MIFALNIIMAINKAFHKPFISHDLDNKLLIAKISLVERKFK